VLSDRAVTFIACAITVAWIGLAYIDAVSETYTVPNAVHGIMGLVAGALFAERGVRRVMRRAAERVLEETED
jgi:hypothetical protein